MSDVDLGPPVGAEAALAVLKSEYGDRWRIVGKWRDGRRIGAWLCSAQRRTLVPGYGDADEPNYLVEYRPAELKRMIERSEDAFPIKGVR